LEQLRQRRLDTELLIDLLCVTRSDDDHAFGLLELTDELLLLDRADEVITFTVDAVWHNPLAVLAAVPAEHLGRWARAARETATTRGLLNSVVHAQRLAQNCEELEIRVNRGRELMSNGVGAIRGDHGIEVFVFGPPEEGIDAAQEALAKVDVKNDRSASEVAFRVLPPIADLTVLFAIAGRRVLFSGDAAEESLAAISAGAQQRGLSTGASLEVDVLRLPRHADAEAIAQLLTRVRARHVLVAGDGRHEDPDPAVLRQVAASAAGSAQHVWMAYAPQELLDHARIAAVEAAVRELEAAGVKVHWPAAGSHSAVVDLSS
jgi:hypothetical protein